MSDPGAVAGDEHEPFRVRVGQRREQHAVENGEDGGDRADRQPQRADDGGGEAGRAPQRAQRVAKRSSPAVQVEAHGLSFLLGRERRGRRAAAAPRARCDRGRTRWRRASGRPPPGRASCRARQSSSACSTMASPKCARNGGGKSRTSAREKRLHERPRASPSRFSATAAVRFSRCVSSASARRPRGGQRVVPARQARMRHLRLGLALGDEAQGDEPRDDAVERAGARLQRAGRLGGDALGDRVAVQRARSRAPAAGGIRGGSSVNTHAEYIPSRAG